MATNPLIDRSAAPNPVADRLLLAEELLDLVERAQSHTHAAGSAIALQCGEKLIIRTSTGTAPEVGSSLTIGEGAIGACARTGKPLNMSEDGKLETAVRALGGRSVAAVPIHHNGISYGVLAVIGTTVEAFTRMHVAIMMTMGNEAARVLKRLESVTSEIAPGVPIGSAPPPPPDNVVPILQVEPAAVQGIAETIKKAEQARPKVEIPKPEPSQRTTPAESKTLHPAQQVAAMSFIDLEAERAQPKPLSDLLPPGEDPRKYGTLKNAKSLQPKPTFAMSSAYRPNSSSSRKAPAIAVAAVLIIAIAGYGFLRHRSATAAAQAPIRASEPTPAAVTPTPVSTPQPEAAKLVAVAITPDSAAAKALIAKPETPKAEPVKAEPVKAEPVKTETAKAEAPKAEAVKKPTEVSEEAPKPKPHEAPLRIAAPSKTGVETVEAPSLSLTAGNAMPVLSAPKIPTASLVVKRSTATPPTLQRSVHPIYPDIARRNGTYGDVRMQLAISREGKVTDVKILQGNPILCQAATFAVRQWQYKPATMDGQAVESTVDVVVKFGQR